MIQTPTIAWDGNISDISGGIKSGGADGGGRVSLDLGDEAFRKLAGDLVYLKGKPIRITLEELVP